MAFPLIDRLTEELGWPLLETEAAVAAFAEGAGLRCLFVPGDPAKNLETADAAVILPEIVRAFRGAFAVGVVGGAVERAVRERYGVWPTPSLIFLRDGQPIGAVPKVRDWDDYLTRVGMILAGGEAPEAVPEAVA